MVPHGLRLNLVERLLKIGDDTLRVLDPHRKTHHRRRNAHGQLILLGYIGVGHTAGMFRKRLGATQAHRQVHELQGIQEPEGLLLTTVKIE